MRKRGTIEALVTPNNVERGSALQEFLLRQMLARTVDGGIPDL